jgi:hypothetical protein
MATTKITAAVLDLNAGRADFNLTATNTVTYVSATGGNQYVFNGSYGSYGVVNGTYVLSSVSSSHPIAIINNGKTSEISYTGAVNEGTGTGPDGNTYTFYSGDVTITVSGNFDTVSYYCQNHGYMGGKDNLIYVSSVGDSGLKIPSGTEVNRPTAVAGQIRNNTNETSNNSASCTEYYNGSSWKVINNAALTLDLSNASLIDTQVLTVTEGNARGWSFVPDGSALYVTSMNGSSQDFLHKYTFSTAFDISTISSGPVGSFQITSPAINNYLSGCIVNAAQDKIAYDPYTNTDWYQQNFGTPGDITTLQGASSFSCSRTGGDRTARSMIFADNENKMYWMSTQMRQFDLTTAGDPSSASNTCPSAIPNTTDSDFSADLDGGNTRTLFFNDNGTQLTIAGDAARFAQFTLSTPYDITTRGAATKYNFDSMLGAGASKEIYVIRPNASYTKLLIASNYQPENTLYELSL